MSLNVDDFKAKLVGGGARANLFKVIINFPAYAGGNSETTSFLCKGAALPASVMGQATIPWRGRELKLPGDRKYDNWTITVINDTDFGIRNAFERWQNGINSHKTNIGKLNPTDYQSDLQVQQLDKGGNVIKTYTIRSAWPVNLAQMDLSYDSTDAIQEFTVEFAYNYWESNTTS